MHRRPAVSATGSMTVTNGSEPRSAGSSVRQRLSLIVVAIVVPMLLLAAGVIWELAENERAASRSALFYSSGSVLSSVDAQLGKYLALAQGLAASPSLQAGDIDVFREEAERALTGLPRTWVSLADPSGQQFVNTLVASTQPLPRVGPQSLADAARAFDTRQPQISDLIIGSVAKSPIIVVGIPVFRGAEPAYYLMITVSADVFRDLLNSRRVPGGWRAAVIDRRGNFVARTRDHEDWVGKPAAAGWQATRLQEGFSEVQSQDGQRLINANSISSVSGWAIGVAAEQSVLNAPIRRMTGVATLVGLAVTSFSILLAAWLARTITVPLGVLTVGAEALRFHRTIPIASTGVREVDRALETFNTASTALIAHERALRESEERFRLIVNGIKDYAVFMLDPDGLIESWNDGCRRLTGYDALDVLGRHFSVFYASDDVAAGELEMALRAGAYEKECEHVNKQGTRFFASVLTTPVFDETGTLRGYSKIMRDITERKAAEESVRSQAALLDLAHDAIIVRAADDTITFWNAGAVRTYGWTAKEARGRIIYELLKTRFPRPSAELRAEVASTGQWDGELIHTRKDGQEIVVASRWAMQRDSTGLPAGGLLEINRDITAAKRAREALRESEERFRALVTASSEVVYRMNADWSEQRELHGREFVADTQTPSRSWLEKYIRPDDRPQVLAIIDAAVRAKSAVEFENRVLRADGSVGWAFSRAIPVRDANGDIVEWFGAASDITARKQAEQELAAMTAHLGAIVDNAVDAIVVIDDHGTVESVNPAVTRMFGYQAEEVVGRNVALLMAEPHRSAHQGYIDAFLRTGVARIIGVGREVDGQRKDGSPLPIDLAVTEWRRGDKRLFTGIMRDITIRRQAEEHIRSVTRELSQRTKNLLATVQSIAWSTARASIDVDDFRQRFSSRVHALARSYALTGDDKWSGAHLGDLVRDQLATFGPGDRVDIDGPDLVLNPAATDTLGLALHELGANACKHGALAQDGGRIQVGWNVSPMNGAPSQFRMSWRETGVAAGGPPQRNGFGHSILKEMTENAFDGHVQLEYTPDGLVWELTAPARLCLAVSADGTIAN